MRTDERADLVEHLEELRTRIIRSLLYIAAGGVAAWFCYDPLYHLLLAPVRASLVAAQGKIIYNTQLEPFMTRLQVSAIAGVIAASPGVLWEIWRFVAPGLTDNERRAVRPLLPVAGALFLAGVVLCYFIAPRGFVWLIGFAPEGTEGYFTLQKQVTLIAKLALAFGLCFELPLVLAFLVKVEVISADTLRRRRREAVVAIFFIAAAATPSTDWFTMMALATPMYALYEGTVWWAVITERRAAKERVRA